MSSQPQLTVVPTEPARYRFGTFDLDTRSGELRRNGVKLRLQDQPFQVLKKLLASPGGVVTREDLHATLWPADTFVDFDTSLNTAIKRLRETLSDSADLPVFIETIPRRGYRFIAPVEAIGKAAPAALTPGGAAGEAVAVHAGGKQRSLWVLGGVAVVAAAIGGLIVEMRAPKPVARVADSMQMTFDGIAKFNAHEGAGNIFYNERAGGHIRLMKIPADGGPPITLDDSTPGFFLADVSLDGTKLLLGVPTGPKQERGRLKIMDLSSGSLLDVNWMIEGSDASWAPGGKIVYTRDGDVFLMNADGKDSHKLLTVNGGHAYRVKFSPDGSRMRLTVMDKMHATASIWEAQADGSRLHQVLGGPGNSMETCCGIWSSDGRYYFFHRNENGTGRIWAEPQHASFWSSKPGPPVPLTTAPLDFQLGSLGQNGNSLVVTASQPKPEVLRYDTAAGKFVQFLNGVPGVDVEASPDGRSFVYVRYPEQTLWRAQSDGSGATQLTGPTMHVGLPHWSPDGKQIAFSGERPGQPWNVFLIPASGGPAEQITHGQIADLDASWSPDGKTIAFGPTHDENGKNTRSIQFVDLATRKVTTLTNSEDICCPRYSPDGRYLITTRSTYDDITLYDFATRKWTTIVKNLGPLGYMNWTRDGKYVVFDTIEVETPRFYRVRMTDFAIEPIADIGDIRRYYGVFGQWSGIWSDGSPLLVRDASNEEIYSLQLQLP
jgi:Tol biopolymer transport system component/DNA-binding winged helix-turn-helix (wHTH) protein